MLAGSKDLKPFQPFLPLHSPSYDVPIDAGGLPARLVYRPRPAFFQASTKEKDLFAREKIRHFHNRSMVRSTPRHGHMTIFRGIGMIPTPPPRYINFYMFVSTKICFVNILTLLANSFILTAGQKRNTKSKKGEAKNGKKRDKKSLIDSTLTKNDEFFAEKSSRNGKNRQFFNKITHSKGAKIMESIENCHKRHKIDKFSLVSAYSWEFYQRMSKNQGKPNENMEICMKVVRIANEIKVEFAPTIPSIINDPYFTFLDEFVSDWFNNLPKTEFSEEKLLEFVGETDIFIATYKDLLAEV
jgi:hypothetical protein